MKSWLTASLAFLFLVTAAGCKRENRNLRTEPARRAIFTAGRESPISPGGPTPEVVVRNPYEGNAQAVTEGERLFNWYNCAVCHGTKGGGGMGLSLIAPALTYGDAPENIYDVIQKGRGMGMPAWGGRIPEDQIWKLVTFVRSLRGLEPAPSRADTLQQGSAQAAK